MLCPLQDALLGEGDPQLCLGAACSSLAVCSLDDDDVLSCVGCEYSDSTSSNWSSTFFEVGRGRFCADFRTDSAFFFGGSQMRGRSDMCPIFDDGDEDGTPVLMQSQSVRRMSCLQWQSRAHSLSLSGESSTHTARDGCGCARRVVGCDLHPYTRPRNARTLSLCPRCTRGYPVRYRVACHNNVTNTWHWRPCLRVAASFIGIRRCSGPSRTMPPNTPLRSFEGLVPR